MSVGELKTMDATGREVGCTEDADKASLLADFYFSIYTEEIDEGPSVSNKIYNECEDIILTTQLVATKLSQLNISKSPGPDLIHPIVLYEVRDVIAYPLKLLSERSLETGQLPADWKYSTITAIYKKGPKSDVGNYRPVSLTSVICKVLESIIRDYSMIHLLKNELLNSQQHGFIKGRSTALQLLNMLDNWTKVLETGGQIDTIYTDYEKAFDKVPHKRLVKKIASFGLPQ